MLIGWATPFNVRSAIGKFSRFVAEELSARGHEVRIIRLETGPELKLDALETSLELVPAQNADLADLDRLVVNFGNHAPYHAQSVSLLARRPPLGIFHDAEMRDFEWGLRYRHGIEVPRLEGCSGTDERPTDLVNPVARPLLGAFAAMCWGAVVHGPHYKETVNRYCSGPVEVIPLCYPDEGASREPASPRSGRRVLIFGVINEHKQPRRVMAALARLQGRLGPIELHLAGAIEDHFRADLLKQAKTLGTDPPHFHGYVSDEKLQALLEDSHAVCCLRYPVTEGGSASLVTALYRQRPLVVADIASYSMVPDNLAYKVSYGDKVEDLEEALYAIFQDSEEAEERAAKAHAWANDRFSAKAYVDALTPLLANHEGAKTLSELARNMMPAISKPDGRAMLSVVPELASVLDWAQNCQEIPN